MLAWMYLEGIATVVEDITQTRFKPYVQESRFYNFYNNNSQAMAVLKQASLSAAIFAPGWVFETQSKSNFFENQDK